MVRFGRVEFISEDVRPFSLANLLDKNVENRLQKMHPPSQQSQREVRTAPDAAAAPRGAPENWTGGTESAGGRVRVTDGECVAVSAGGRPQEADRSGPR